MAAMLDRVSRAGMSLSIALGTVLLLSASVQAQAIRFIATDGLNTNDCTRAAPCRTLPRGIAATPDGAALQILDSGSFGNAATIDKSITISAVGVAATAGAITIDAPGATVVLRGLLLTGRAAPSDASGISVV